RLRRALRSRRRPRPLPPLEPDRRADRRAGPPHRGRHLRLHQRAHHRGDAPAVSLTPPLTPAEIVAELDRYIVGQHLAKKAVAIALRNRWRRQNLPPELPDQAPPKNIITIAPTATRNTEIPRRP